MNYRFAAGIALVGTALWAQTDKPSPIHFRPRTTQPARSSPAPASAARSDRAAKHSGLQSRAESEGAKPVLAGNVETGLASFYGDSANGSRMSNGELFDNDKMIAAHRSLPFGTRVLVTNLATGQSVVVTISDRGSFSGPRVINVSGRAAQELGFIKAGRAQVSLRVIAEYAKL